MRLFITSYQKSGTHQIAPVFVVRPDVVDRSSNEMLDMPRKYKLNTEIDEDGVRETVENLRVFKFGSDKAFGHLSYVPEYADVFRETNTKVLFNIRDPRDVVIAEYENALRKFEQGDMMPLWNFYDTEKDEYLFSSDDPIAELIVLAAARWPRWLGWLDHDFVKPVKYENLRLRTRETVEDIIEWLDGVGCSDVDTMVKNTIPKPKNPTFRKGSPGEWKTAFTLHHVELADEMLGGIIERLGY